MPSRRPSSPDHRRLRLAGISLLILGLGHAPMPSADFHSIRHHDAPGEVCRYHDHLLRWHPSGTLADDIARLHWHWVLPGSGPINAAPEGDGPALLAKVGDWSGLAPEGSARLVPDLRGRGLDPCERGSTPIALPLALDPGWAPPPRAGPRPSSDPGTAIAPGLPLHTLLQRWSC